MKQAQIWIERYMNGFWSYQQRSAGRLGEAGLHTTLKWVLEQLNFGNFQEEADEKRDVVTLVVGRRAAPRPFSEEEVKEEAFKRLDAVSFARVIAKDREEGTQPPFRGLFEELPSKTGPWGHINTEFHFAFQLLNVLERCSRLSHLLFAPPIKGKAPERLIWFLGEATRCYLYGFHRASIALCRACLEEALKTKLDTERGKAKLREDSERSPDKGYLQRLIDVASELGYLTADPWRAAAHAVRGMGNKILHNESVKEADCEQTMTDTRAIVENLFTD